jgi:hypothetical protein
MKAEMVGQRERFAGASWGPAEDDRLRNAMDHLSAAVAPARPRSRVSPA